ncbi:MAG: hypothetical protein ACJAS1_001862 [Oleiphilaceae bacterium]|jgi:hypothetical protein
MSEELIISIYMDLLSSTSGDAYESSTNHQAMFPAIFANWDDDFELEVWRRWLTKMGVDCYHLIVHSEHADEENDSVDVLYIKKINTTYSESNADPEQENKSVYIQDCILTMGMSKMYYEANDRVWKNNIRGKMRLSAYSLPVHSVILREDNELIRSQSVLNSDVTHYRNEYIEDVTFLAFDPSTLGDDCETEVYLMDLNSLQQKQCTSYSGDRRYSEGNEQAIEVLREVFNEILTMPATK